jgi:hypothetical protein
MAAKILSGWKDDQQKVSSYFDPGFHNTSDKLFSSFYGKHVIKGRAGADGAIETDELIEMVCKQKETPKFLCRKLYRWFVNCNIDDQVEKEVIAPLADIFISSNYEINPVMRALLTSDFFYDPHLIGCIIKSPIDFMIGLFRELNVKSKDYEVVPFRTAGAVSIVTSAMGQDIGDPPSVAGWPAYYEFPIYDREWVTSDAIYNRNSILKGISGDTSDPDLGKKDSICVDFIAFIERFADPGDAKRLMPSILELLFAVELNANQIAYLENILNTGKDLNDAWDKVWAKYTAQSSDTILREEVKMRLKNLFGAMLLCPEYQIR